MNPDDLRTFEKEFVTLELNNDTEFLAIYDLRYITKMQSILSIVTTLLVCIILTFGSLQLSKQTNELLISPIESMIHKVNRIAQNPVKAAQEDENE